jgi:uncharacterized protein (TIGR00725 family)
MPDKICKSYIGVIGAGNCTPEVRTLAFEVGRLIAESDAVLVCGGLGGVMESASRGAKSAGGATIGILPGRVRSDANQFIDHAIPTGFGEARNVIVVNTSDALIALAGEYGTMSEIALALKSGKPVIDLGGWNIPATITAKTPQEAVRLAQQKTAKTISPAQEC